MAEVAPFADFYRAANEGRNPLPWQERLANTIAAHGWPKEIGVPTGLGKTSCIDIAVWALARTATSPERRQPTRIWYVVNRRLLVDAAWEHALHLHDILADPGSLHGSDRDAVASVADALRSVAAFGGDPLHVVRLRGGADLGIRAPDPSQPCVVLATVPMYASRLLFRGYGSSTSMRPVDAAHAGIDSLVLLDEAHLARPLLRLAEQAADCDVGDPAALLPAGRCRPVVVALTATGEEAGQRFDLDDDDRDHPIVSQRLRAPKRGKLVETSDKNLPAVLAEQALSTSLGTSGTCVVFANSPSTARATADKLMAACHSRHLDIEVLLVTGRVRDREGDRLRDRLLDPSSGVKAGRDRVAQRPLVVVATQTLEVGADVDFDHLVTETSGVRSLIQRLGRVNRLGTRDTASCVICHPADRKTWPIYHSEPEDVWAKLRAAEDRGDIDLSPGNVSALLGPPADAPQRVGQLLPAHLWEWAKTSSPPPGEAPVELFFEGFDAGIDVSVVWRAHRPDDGLPLIPGIVSSEAVDVPIWDLRDAMGERTTVRRLAADGASLETVSVGALRPGDVVVLAPEDGLYDEHGWNPSSEDVVLDVSPLLTATLLLTEPALENLAPGSSVVVGEILKALVEPADDEEVSDEAVAELVDALVGGLRSCPPHPWLDEAEWHSFLDGLGRRVAMPIDGVPSIGPARAVRSWATAAIRHEVFEELSFSPQSSSLAHHLGAVGETAELIAKKLGLPPAIVGAVRAAGRWHDLGKYDARFQRWLDPTGEALEPLAKSRLAREQIERARVAAGWPRGGRHELLSVRLARALLDERTQEFDGCDGELVLHLVAAHHGNGRPLVPVVADLAPTRVAAEVAGRRVIASGDLAAPDWDQPRRFRRVCERYGLWGVALLEAVVRQADHAVSRFVGVA